MATASRVLVLIKSQYREFVVVFACVIFLFTLYFGKLMGNLFVSWLEFRSVIFGESREDVLGFLNSENGTNLGPPALAQFCGGAKACPDNILILIEDDFENFIPWLLERAGIFADVEQTKKLADSLRFPIKRAS